MNGHCVKIEVSRAFRGKLGGMMSGRMFWTVSQGCTCSDQGASG